MRIHLQGELEFMPLPDLLQWLEMSRKTGELRLSGVGADRSVYIENGKIIFASSEEEGQRFGEFLTRQGRLSDEDVKKALVESRRLGVCFTQYLIDRGYSTPANLTETLSDLLETIFVEVMTSRTGTFAFSSPLPRIIRQGPIRLASGFLIMESIRKMDEATR